MDWKGTSSRNSKTLACAIAIILLLPIIPMIMGDGQNDIIDHGQFSIDTIYWPMMGRDAFNTNEGSTSGRGLQDPFGMWSDVGNSTVLGSVGADMTKNVNFSTVSERTIRFIVDSNRTHVFIRDGDNGAIAWSIDVRDIEERVTNNLWVSPALMDTDSDGRLEVLIAISEANTHQLALFEPNITLTSTGYIQSLTSYPDEMVWISIYGPQGNARTSSPMIHDISGDGIEDVIIGAGNRLYAYHGTNGTIMWYLDIGPIGEALSTPAIYPGSGAIQRIVINSFLAGRRTLRTTVVNYNGYHLNNITSDLTSALIGYPFPVAGPVPVPVVTDVTDDASPDILVPYPAISSFGRVVVYSYTLDEILTIDDIIGQYDGGISVCDMVPGGGDEILIQSRGAASPNTMVSYEVFWDGTKHDSRRVWTRAGITPGSATLYGSPLSCDLNEDGVPDAVFPSNGQIYGILSDGTYYWNHTMDGFIPNGFGLIGDLNMDGFCDLYLHGRLYSQKLIDLKVKEPYLTNIYLDNSEPVDGSTVTVNCVIENTQSTDVLDVVVKFIDLDGPSGELLIGYDRIDIVETAEASVEWIPQGDGNHDILIMIDPDQNITEIDETNNNGENTFTVLSAFSDITVTAIHFLRGDGQLITDKRLVENDPSWIVVTVANIGQKPSTGGTLRVNVNGAGPNVGNEYSDIDPIGLDDTINITVPWTPEEIPEGQEEIVSNIEAWVSLPTGQDEISEDNNYLSNSTKVKNATPSGSLYIQGEVKDTNGEAASDVRMTLTVNRTGEVLGPIQTDNDGIFGFDMNFIDYLDGDIITIRGSKEMMWGENSTSVYSEDVIKDLNIELTDIPTLSIFVTPLGETEDDVVPGQEVIAYFTVENDGNVAGDVTISKEQEGNSSLTTNGIRVTPSTFLLAPGETRQVEMALTVPDGEEPEREILALLVCSISGNTTVQKKLRYQYSIKGDEQVLFQMVSNADVILGPSSYGKVSFEFYIYNKGNIPFDYEMTLSSSLEDHVSFRDGSGELYPDGSVSPFADLSMPNGSESVSGTISLITSKLRTVASWDISVKRSFPDLRVKGVIGSDPASPSLGSEIQLLATIDNSGTIGVTDIVCSFYEGDTLIGTRTIEHDLEPGEDVTITGITWTPIGIGDHTVTFRVDPSDEVPETDETNNEVKRNFSFHPDLSIKSISFENERPTERDTMSIRVSVENEGNAPLSKGFRITITVDTRTGDQLVSDTFEENLDPLWTSTRTVTLDVIVPSGGGNRTIYVVVEPVADDLELDISDNTFSKDLEIRGNDESNGLMGYLPYMIGILVLMALAGGGFYVWKNGLPIGPPPDESGDEIAEPEMEGVNIESGEIPKDDEVMEMDISSAEEAPVIEMEVLPSEDVTVEEEPVLVAEIIEAEIEEDEVSDPFDDEEMIPEV